MRNLEKETAETPALAGQAVPARRCPGERWAAAAGSLPASPLRTTRAGVSKVIWTGGRKWLLTLRVLSQWTWAIGITACRALSVLRTPHGTGNPAGREPWQLCQQNLKVGDAMSGLDFIPGLQPVSTACPAGSTRDSPQSGPSWHSDDSGGFWPPPSS